MPVVQYIVLKKKRIAVMDKSILLLCKHWY